MSKNLFERYDEELQFMPHYTEIALRHYVNDGLEPGGFLKSVLENDLVSAIFRADVNNYSNIKAICRFVQWELPQEAWGSPEKVAQWLQKFRRQAS